MAAKTREVVYGKRAEGLTRPRRRFQPRVRASQCSRNADTRVSRFALGDIWCVQHGIGRSAVIEAGR